MHVISRRDLLMGFSTAPLLAEATAAKLKIVVVGGHPGDPEYGCGGTVARYGDEGHSVTLLYLNRGQHGCGSTSAEQCAATRTGEAEHACQILKAQPRFADQVDGETVVDAPHYEQFRAVLEAERPDIVFTHWPVDNHRDHRAASSFVHDAWLHWHKDFALYYYEVSDGSDTLLFSPTSYVDISSVETRKRSACYAHASQAPDKFYALQSQVTRFRGLERGCAQAEAFVELAKTSKALLP